MKEEWIDKMATAVTEGGDLVGRSSDEALDYIVDMLENFGDKAWRNMAVEQHALEIGIGEALSDTVVPKVYESMKKTMHKKTPLDKKQAELLSKIYMGRVMKNIIKEMEKRSGETE